MRFDFKTVSRGLMAALPSAGFAMFGLMALGYMMLTMPPLASGARAAPQQIGVVFAPWSPSGMAAAARFDLPIIALRWGGHLAILDISGAPDARRVLQDLGQLIINTSAPPSCMNQGETGV